MRRGPPHGRPVASDRCAFPTPTGRPPDPGDGRDARARGAQRQPAGSADHWSLPNVSPGHRSRCGTLRWSLCILDPAIGGHHEPPRNPGVKPRRARHGLSQCTLHRGLAHSSIGATRRRSIRSKPAVEPRGHQSVAAWLRASTEAKRASSPLLAPAADARGASGSRAADGAGAEPVDRRLAARDGGRPRTAAASVSSSPTRCSSPQCAQAVGRRDLPDGRPPRSAHRCARRRDHGDHLRPLPDASRRGARTIGLAGPV